MWYCDGVKSYDACSWRKVRSPHRGDRPARTHPGGLGEASLPSEEGALHIITIIDCVPIHMWYSHDMKRYGECSLGEGGPCFGSPTPLPFGPTGSEGRVDEQTQVVDFHDSFTYFQVLRCFQWNVKRRLGLVSASTNPERIVSFRPGPARLREGLLWGTVFKLLNPEGVEEQVLMTSDATLSGYWDFGLCNPASLVPRNAGLNDSIPSGLVKAAARPDFHLTFH